MTTLVPITSGRATVAGYDVAKNPDAVRRVIASFPRRSPATPTLPSRNLSIYAKLYSVPKVERQKNINEVLEAVDLVKWRGAQVKTLSGGMRRRVEIARAWSTIRRSFFSMNPHRLDPVSRIAVYEMLDNLRKTRHLTMLLTTHYMEEADTLCDRIAIVDHGNLVALALQSSSSTAFPVKMSSKCI